MLIKNTFSMAVIVRESDYHFLLSSERFCINIDKYRHALQINEASVTAYKENNNLLIQVFDNPAQYPAYAEHFIRSHTRHMRAMLSALAHACRSSDRYNITIGEELGIESGAFL